jgi:hypothetical protein
LKVVAPAAKPAPVVTLLPQKTQIRENEMDTTLPFQPQTVQQQTDASVAEETSGSDSMLQLSRLSAPASRVKMMKAALFQVSALLNFFPSSPK